MKKYRIKIKGIVKCNDKYLIVKKWYDDRIDEPYQWSFLDTDLEDGDVPENGCLSYIQESTGMYVQLDRLAYSWVYSLGDNNFLGLAFVCKADDEMVIMSEEISGYKWVSAEEIATYIHNGSLLRDLKKAGIII